ncbi:ESYT1 protein, partial [Rhinopomastus cyanomelas]|nr:ESYT1 protein [Rhinopomastus cyanomelas]
QVLHINTLLQPPHNPQLSAALLSVFVDRAADLPVRRALWGGPQGVRGGLSPSLSCPQTCAPSTDPVWDEGFSFLIKRPQSEALELQVKDEGGQSLGALSLPLPQLLASEGLALDGWFPLAGGGPSTQILLRVQLGVSVSLPTPLGTPWLSPSTAGGPGWGWGTDLLPCSSPPEAAEGPLGVLQLTLWYHRDQQKLVAIAHCCRKLRPLSKELPDPYLSLLLQPDRGRSTKRKTDPQKKTLNPDFNERFEWDLTPEEVSRCSLEVQVKSRVSFVSREKEVLGKLHLDLAQVDLSNGGTHW